MAAFRSATVAGTGVYQMEQDDYDRDMIIVPFATAARLLSYDDQATGIAVYLTPTASRATIAALQQLCEQQNLNLKDRHRQQEQAFRMIAIEKWITFLMLAFILVIASFNIISTLSMLIIEKEGNMNILRAMGAGRRMLSGIFVWQGWLIVILGGIVGIALGALLVALQQQFGWIKLGGADTSLLSVDTYPVELQFTDIAVTLLTIAAVALLISPIIPLIRRNKE
jgi:ABC-type lipoprotein release transport system permease subunit